MTGLRLINTRDFQRSIGKDVREPLDAKKKKKVRERAKGTCEWKKSCKETHCHYHHMNGISWDNRLFNIKYFCPTHHSQWHRENKIERDKDILNRRIGTKVIKRKVSEKKPTKKKVVKAKPKKTTKKKSNPFGIKPLNFRT